MEVINKIGRRKSAVARVYIQEGKGNITVNNKDYKVYFPSPQLQYIVTQPLSLTSSIDKFDIKVNIFGGGFKGQAESVRLAISRALVAILPTFVAIFVAFFTMALLLSNINSETFSVPDSL